MRPTGALISITTDNMNKRYLCWFFAVFSSMGGRFESFRRGRFPRGFGSRYKDSGLSEFSDHASRTVSEWQLVPSPN